MYVKNILLQIGQLMREYFARNLKADVKFIGLLKCEYTESDAVTERIEKTYFITFYTGDLLKLTL